jgi:hypothetical protein
MQKGSLSKLCINYVKKKKSNPERDIKMQPHYNVYKVFTEEQGSDLAKYINTLRKICYGLSTTALWQLALEMATENGSSIMGII